MAIQHFGGERYQLYAWVVMNDHIHVLFRPLDDRERSAILHSWKSFTANQLQRRHGRRGTVWQDESWDRIVRDEDELLEKWNYILNNPAKRWPEERNYKWVSRLPRTW